MPLRISALYLAIFAFFYVGLSINVIRNRWKHKINLGDNSHPPMRGAVRAHGNFAEYTPFVMLMVAVLEFCDIGAPTLHAIAGLLLVGRLLHSYGLLTVNGPSKGRAIGMVCTLLSIILGGLALVSVYFEKT